jgi:FSR family fosmidomycin resistance protein-like MFS transporter
VILGAVSLWGLEGSYRLIPFGLLSSFILHLKIRKIQIADALKSDQKLSGFRKTFIDMLPFFLLLVGFTLLRSVMKAALTTFLPTFITSKGQSIWMGGISLSIVQLAGAAGTFLGGSISDKIGRKTTLMIISIASPVLMWLFIISEGVYTIPILIILGFLIIAPSPVLLALVQDQNSKHPSFVNGIYMTINFGIGAVAVVAIGAMGDWIGLEWTYKISAILSIFTIPFLLKLPERAL